MNRVLQTVILTVLICFAAQAQSPVSWSVGAPPKEAKAGGQFNLPLSASISGDWHMYSITQGPGGPIRTTINVGGGPFRPGGAVRGPRPKVEMDPNFGINTETYAGSAAFTVPVSVAKDAQPGPASGEVSVRFQVCNDTTCLPPRTEKLSFAVNILAAAPAATPTPGASPSPTPTATPKASPSPSVTPSPGASPTVSPTPEILALTQDTPAAPDTAAAPTTNLNASGSLWSFLWAAIIAGALSLLTPCVFPMIPITVSYFTNHAAGHRGAAVRDAVIYALGIILTFTAIGLLLSVLFGAAGLNKFAANPWINLLITAIFVVFALSLFGAFNIGVPARVLSRLDAMSNDKSSGHIISLLLMGLTFSLTSFTCTAPFVGTVLVASSQGQLFYPLVGMLAFSTIFALPFFVLALAPQLVAQLPRSGGWLNSVKVVMGLLEVAAAMKFLSNVDLVWQWGIFTREVVLAVWVAVALLIGLYLLGKFQLTHDYGLEHIGAGRLMFALVSFALGFYLLTGLFGKPLGELESFLPPPITQADAPKTDTNQHGELTWITNDYEAAVKQAKAENKPMFIDFTGYTCTNCRWMETNMFTRPAVRREMAKFIRLRLYTDGEGELYERHQAMQQKNFGTVALPYYVLLNGDGKPAKTFPGLTRNEGEFVNFLKSGQPSGAAGD
jgi:thiol:disulfide interchange protein DsbD